jgi:hypothetical protein
MSPAALTTIPAIPIIILVLLRAGSSGSSSHEDASVVLVLVRGGVALERLLILSEPLLEALRRLLLGLRQSSHGALFLFPVGCSAAG